MKKLNLTKNTIRNFIWGIINKMVSLLLPFVIRIFIVNILGKEYLGLNNLFSSILNVLNLAELGVGSAMVYSMYRPIAEDDASTICTLLNLYKKTYRIIGTGIFIVGCILAPFLPYLISGETNGINIYLIYYIFLIDTVLSYLLFAYKSSLLTAHQRTDINSNINTVIQIVLNIFQISAIFLFKNYYLYIFLKPIFTLINNICVNIITNNIYPNYQALGTVAPNIKKDIIIKIRALIGHKIGTTVISSADSLVISAFLGLEVLAIYSNYYYIIFFVVSVSGIILNGMLAGIGNSLIVESNTHNYELFENVNFIMLWVVTWCSTCLLCLLQPFMKIWMGEDMLLSFHSLIYIIIYYYSWQMRCTGLYFKDAAGMWREDFWKPYIAAAFNLIMNLLLVKRIGVNGVFISTIISMVFINFPWETRVLFKSLFLRSAKRYIINQLLNIIKTLVVCFFTYYLCLMISVDNLLDLLIRFILCIFVPNLIFVLLSIKTIEFKNIINMVRSKIRR